jgi:hypothetical protein
MWNYLVENKILYSNKRMDILRYINDGPYTSGFPIESPARLYIESVGAGYMLQVAGYRLPG